MKYQWISDGGSCKACASLDGKIFDSLSEVPQLPLHPSCKCRLEIIQVEETTNIGFLDKINEIINKIEADRVAPFIFAEEYATMMVTNAKGHDKHQHALANARATSHYGKAGEDWAIAISNLRDNPDKFATMTEENRKDSEADQVANRIGRELGFKYPKASRKFLSDKLKEEYRN